MKINSDLEGILALKESGPGGIQPVLVEDLGLLGRLLEGLLANLFVFIDDGVNFFFGGGSLLDQLVGIQVLIIITFFKDKLVHGNWFFVFWGEL